MVLSLGKKIAVIVGGVVILGGIIYIIRKKVISSAPVSGNQPVPPTGQASLSNGYASPWDIGIPLMLDQTQKIITLLQVKGNKGNTDSLQKQLDIVSNSGNPDAIADLLSRTVAELKAQYWNKHPDAAHQYNFLGAMNKSMQSGALIQGLIKSGQSDLLKQNVQTMMTIAAS